MPSTRRLGAAVLSAVGLTYLPSLGGGWAWDDRTWVDRPADIWGALVGSGDIPLWRPLGALPTVLLHAAGAGPLAHRLLSLALHLGAVAAVAGIARRSGARGTVAWFGAALFGLHAGSSEPVAWISGQTELIPAALTLLGWGALARAFQGDATGGRRWEWAAGAAWALTPFAKEAWLLVPAAGAILCWGYGRWSWRALGTAAGGGATYLLLRQAAHSHASLDAISFEPFGPLGYLVRRGFELLLVPATADACPLYAPAYVTGILATLGVLVAIAASRRRPWLAAAVAMLPILAPNALAAARNGLGADRYYYLPLAALGVAVALGAEALLQRPSPRGLALAWLLPLLLAPITMVRATEWGSSAALFSASLARDPTNPYAAFGYADVLSEAGRCADAVPLYRLALEKDIRALGPLQTCLGRLGRLDEIVALADRATTAPTSANLVRALLGLDRLADADRISQQAITLFPDDGPLYTLRGQTLHALGRDDEAAAAFRAAATLGEPPLK